MSDNPNEGNQYDNPNQEVVGTDIVLDVEAQPIEEPEPEEETPEETPVEPEPDEPEPETEPV